MSETEILYYYQRIERELAMAKAAAAPAATQAHCALAAHYLDRVDKGDGRANATRLNLLRIQASG